MIEVYVSPYDKCYTDKGMALTACSKHQLATFKADFPLEHGMTVFCNTENGKIYRNQKESLKDNPSYGEWGYCVEVDTSKPESIVGRECRMFIQEDQPGKFSIGLNLSSTPGTFRIKRFFPDRSWTGPIFEGYARIRITKEFDSYGFFVGTMELIEEQQPDGLANVLADRVMNEGGTYNIVTLSSRLLHYKGERGIGYLVESAQKIGPTYYFFTEDGSAYPFNANEVKNGELTFVSYVRDFIAKHCYEREDFILSKDIAPIKMGSRCRPCPWSTAMNLLDNELYQFSEKEDVDVEELLEILQEARYIVPVSFADEVFFKSHDGDAVKLFCLSSHELQLALAFINEHNALAEKNLASKIKSGKVHVVI